MIRKTAVPMFTFAVMCTPLVALPADAQVYVDQIPAAASNPAFVTQLPQSARPRVSQPGQAELVRQQQPRQFIVGRPTQPAVQRQAQAQADTRKQVAAARQSRFPSAGAGTTAVINTDVPPELPSVGTGTVRLR